MFGQLDRRIKLSTCQDYVQPTQEKKNELHSL